MSSPKNGSVGPIWMRDNSAGATAGTFIIASLVAPACINVADPVGLVDNQASMLSMDAAGRLRALVTAAAGSVFTTAPQAFQSVGVAARVVAPGAGGAIATIAAGSLPAGTYDVQVLVMFDTGAPVVADINNMEFRRGAAVISSLQVNDVVAGYAGGTNRTFRMIMDGATALSVNATAAGTAGVGYNAQLIATRVA